MSGNHARSSGFTLVELLIVIVVIAILASITVVAFNGIQSRAKQAKILAAVDAYADAFELYKLDNNDALPVDGLGLTPGTQYILCLGEASTYPAEDVFAQSECSLARGGSPSGVVNETVNTRLRTVMANLPDARTPTVKRPGGTGRVIRGAFINITADGQVSIDYWSDGRQECARGTTTVLTGGGMTTTQCQLILREAVS